MAPKNEKALKPITILMADDDEDDLMLTRDAFLENRFGNELKFVRNGEELMDYLNHRGVYNAENAPLPDIILLDLNMPRKDGRESLKEIKSSSKFKSIPVVILTTSKADEDVLKSYELGVNSFITKPVTFSDMIRITKTLGDYGFEIVRLPMV